MLTHSATALRGIAPALPRQAGTVNAAPWRTALAADDGAATAEYAIATLAAVGFAGLLVVIMRSDEVRGLLLGIVRRALNIEV